MSDLVTGAMIATAVAGAAAVVADAILMATSPNPPAAAAVVAHPAIGAVWIAAGLVAWARYPTFRTGPLMIVSGFLWLALVLFAWRGTVSVTFGQPIDFLSFAVAAHLFVAFPSGRLRTRTDRLLVSGVYANAFVLGGLARQLFLGPKRDWCAGECGRNLLLVHDDPGLLRVSMACSIVIGAGLVLAIAWRLARRMQAASPAGKAVLGPVLCSGAAALLAALAVGLTAWAGYELAVVCVWISWGIVPVAFLIGLLRARLRRAAVTRLILELGDLPSPARVRDALARALGDPSLELVFWSQADEHYLTVEGVPTSIPAEDPHRAVTLIDQRGERFAALVHDPFILEDRELLDAVGAAARLAIDTPSSSTSCRRSSPRCAPRERASWPPATRSGGGSSATCTAARRGRRPRRWTGPSSACWASALRFDSRAGARARRPSACCWRPTRNCAPRSTSCVPWHEGSIPPCSPTKGWPPRSAASPTARPSRSTCGACRTGGCRRTSRPRPTSSRPRRWPTSPSTPRRRR
jgi:hypothetical protein